MFPTRHQLVCLALFALLPLGCMSTTTSLPADEILPAQPTCDVEMQNLLALDQPKQTWLASGLQSGGLKILRFGDDICGSGKISVTRCELKETTLDCELEYVEANYFENGVGSDRRIYSPGLVVISLPRLPKYKRLTIKLIKFYWDRSTGQLAQETEDQYTLSFRDLDDMIREYEARSRK